ncbi:MAG: isoprenylcysteine carboxylmethyltransferase family protein [Planctomycetes bacterium]|nr:isoprenylcysteine carboxylmethyltransferase family protein [Planctomycetota bacterium]
MHEGKELATTRDWRDWSKRHRWLFALVVMAKRTRTPVATAIVIGFLVEGIYNREVPVDLDQPSVASVLGLLLVTGGVMFRLLALGSIRKRERLATTGVYSICRHPLYFGTFLMGAGVCILLNDPKSYIVMAAYFAAFYPLTIFREEIRLSEKFGAAHRRYAAITPVFLPIGRYRHGPWSARRMIANQGTALLAVTFVLLACIEMMAETMQRRP